MQLSKAVVHILGYTVDQFLNAYPFESADSSTFIAATRFGASQLRLKICGRSFSHLPHPQFSYMHGEVEGERGRVKSNRLAGYNALYITLNWRGLLEAFQAQSAEFYSKDYVQEKIV